MNEVSTIQAGTVAGAEAPIHREWRDVLREMHLIQAKAWRESAAHWRAASEKAWKQENVGAAAHALMIANLAESYAQEEEKAAKELGSVGTVVPTAENGASVLADGKQQCPADDEGKDAFAA